MEYFMEQMQEYQCELCENVFYFQPKVQSYRVTRKIANGRNLCKECTKRENSKSFAATGAKTLTSFSTEEKSRYCSYAGKCSGESDKPNSGRFSTDRWNNLTEEEQLMQVKRAAAGLHEKLKDPIFAAQYYAKIFAQTKIGYQSKGHKDLHGFISELGFISHAQISNMQVDECNEELKIVVEYNGDMWHCNPSMWKADEYNSAIHMTAGQKWSKDIARKAILRKMGYTLIAVWESDWQTDAAKQISKIKEIVNAKIEKQEKNPPTHLL